MSTWKLEYDRGCPILVPIGTPERRALDLAAAVPGTFVDTGTGCVTGSIDALGAVLLEVDASRVTPPPAKPLKWKAEAALLPFQRVGVEHMIRAVSTGALCMDDVGLGKTVQTIAAMNQLDPRAAKIVLCPAFLRHQWKAEIEKWVPLLGGKAPVVHVLKPESAKRKKDPDPPVSPDWIVGYYADAMRALSFADKRAYFLILDEVHNLRGYKSKRIVEVKQISTFALGRVGLTASFLYNDGAKLHPVLDVALPGVFGSYTAFVYRYCSGQPGAFGGVDPGELSHADELRYRLGFYGFRRVKEEVWEQLPFDVRFQTVELEAPPGAVQQLGGLLKTGLERGGNSATMVNYLRGTAIYKTPFVTEQILSDRASGVPSITFTYLRDHATVLSKSVPDSFLALGDGDASARLAAIADYVKRCQASEITPCLIGTYGAIGEGANLQWAKVVNIAALDYTPDVIRQGIGRAARMGQEGVVTTRVFVAKRTLDEHMIAVLRRKLNEQFDLAGGKERSKKQLFDAIGPEDNLDEALRKMYEEALASEGREEGAA